MIFDYKGYIVTLDDPAQYPSFRKLEKVQVKERSASKVLHTENYNIEIEERTHVFKEMSDNDFQKLFDFFDNIVDGMSLPFYLTDDLGNREKVKFTSPILDFQISDFKLWEGQFTVEVVD
jgi:hypothetical protein